MMTVGYALRTISSASISKDIYFGLADRFYPSIKLINWLNTHSLTLVQSNSSTNIMLFKNNSYYAIL